MTVLQLQDVTKSYVTPAGERDLIINVPSFELREGEQVALVGESGEGKSTLLNLIAGITRPDRGAIHIDGWDITALSESVVDSLRARFVGYIFQTFNLLQGFSAIENVSLAMAFGKGTDRKVAADLLERVGLADRMRYKPSQLSSGQQQRVAVARALANRPKLVLADEPTGNLDPKRAAEVIALIREICAEQSAALLLVTHDHRIAEQFDRIVALGDINRARQSAEAIG